MAYRRRAALQLPALLLAGALCADLAFDAACDAVLQPSAARTTLASGAGEADSDDACAGFCVPDCFCCSRCETAGSAVTIPPPACLDEVMQPPTLSLTPVSPPVPERPPLALS